MKFRVERPPKEPNAVVIYPPEGMPAYIPNCAEYAFRMLQKLAAAQQADGSYCYGKDNHLLKDGELCSKCGFPKPPAANAKVGRTLRRKGVI